MMKLPAWLKATPAPSQPDPGALTVDISVDLRRWREALDRTIVGQIALIPGFQRAVQAAADMEAELAKAAAILRPWKLDPVRLAGLEAKHYVRGALAPLYADPVDRDRYVRLLTQGLTGDAFLMLLAPDDRAKLAAAFLRGWVEHRDGTECICQPTPESMHFVYYGVTEPGSAWEWDPDCPVHPASSFTLRSVLR